MLTGLSLHGIDATLVPLLRLPEGYRAVALGMAGTYDRYGAIDGIDEDANTALVLGYFLRRLGTGRLRADRPADLGRRDVGTAGRARHRRGVVRAAVRRRAPGP
jgi:hypothetical protein